MTPAARPWPEEVGRARIHELRPLFDPTVERVGFPLDHPYRLLPPEWSPVGRTLEGEELAIDKVLALFDDA